MASLISPTVKPPPPGIVEVDTVIGENRKDLVRHGRDKMAKELGGNLGGRFLMSSTKANFDVRSMATKR
jgi:hypothetical protein